MAQSDVRYSPPTSRKSCRSNLKEKTNHKWYETEWIFIGRPFYF